MRYFLLKCFLLVDPNGYEFDHLQDLQFGYPLSKNLGNLDSLSTCDRVLRLMERILWR